MLIFCMFLIFSDAAMPGFSYCGDNGLNFSTNSANFSEDDADFAPGKRNKPSRVSEMMKSLNCAPDAHFYFHFNHVSVGICICIFI